MTGRLSDIIVGAAAKRLTRSEALPSVSNQHEFYGNRALQGLFGAARLGLDARFVHLGGAGNEPVEASGFLTWYDAREQDPVRTEFRLYFPATAATERLAERDLALFLRLKDGSLLAAFAAEGSTGEQQLEWLFGQAAAEGGLDLRAAVEADRNVDFAAREILETLGLVLEVAPAIEESDLDALEGRFPDGFPTTAEFSEFARGVTRDADPLSDPDGALMMWLEREEALFRQVERRLVLKRLERGFGTDVDGFIQYSLSVQNRRKSRVGYAVENHLEAVFQAWELPYSRNARTERQSKPDFLFPGIDSYREASFPDHRLRMLGVKSTCKDRWRQVLVEAERVSRKHLFTLEPGISANQTEEMRARDVQLVVPASIQPTFAASQRVEIINLAEFLDEVRNSIRLAS